MKNWLKYSALSCCLLGSTVAISPAAAEGLQLGAGVGYFTLDFDQLGEEESFLATAVQIGYEYFNTPSIAIAAEAEFTSSLTEGKVANEDYSYQSIGAFATLRTKTRWSFIGRLGVLESKIDFEDSPTAEGDAIVLGVGIGFGGDKDGIRREIRLDSIEYDDYSALFLSFGLGF